MNKFDKSYFSSLYRSPEDKNPPTKIQAYLRIVKRTVLGLGGQPPTGRPKLLDIGCGYGQFLKAAESYFQTYGIDTSAYVIGEAKKIARKTVFRVSTLESYNPDKQFDMITAFDVLEHTEDVDASLEKICSLLYPNGIFVAVVPVYDELLGMIGGLLDKDPTHIQKLNRWRWLKLFQARFEILEKQGAVRYSFPLGVYFHTLVPWFFSWGQAVLVVMKKL